MRLSLGTLLAMLLFGAALGAQTPVVAAASPVAPAPGIDRSVPVAARPLPRGASLTAADWQILAVTVRQSLRTAAAAESGWVTRRFVAAGEPLIEPAVGPPALVTAGQPVTYVAGTDGVHLTIRGTAATAGSLGQLVWVRVDAGRRLRGLVTAPGTVSADTTSLR